MTCRREAEERFLMTGKVGSRPVEPYSGGGMGGPGVVVAYTDDGVHPGPGELEEERYYDLKIVRRVQMMEQIVVSRGGKCGCGGKSVGKSVWESKEGRF